MKYIIVDTESPMYSRFVELDGLATVMWGESLKRWMLLQVDAENGTKKHIPWPEPVGDPYDAELVETELRQALYS